MLVWNCCRRSLISILVFGAFLSGCVTARTEMAAAQSAAAFTFEQHHVVIGSAKRQTVLTGFLLDGPVAHLGRVGREAKAVLVGYERILVDDIAQGLQRKLPSSTKCTKDPTKRPARTASFCRGVKFGKASPRTTAKGTV